MHLRRFWFQFAAGSELPAGLGFGCGVTAFHLDDARQLLRDRVFEGGELPVLSVIEDVDVSELDAGHVLPNMSPPDLRGVWFPLGYAR